MVLIEAQIVHIHAEVNIEAAIAIIVGYCRMGEGSLRRTRKLEASR